MPDRPASEIELLRVTYAAFNARDIDATLSTMMPDVAWPKAFKGGFVQGPQAVRACWTEEQDRSVEPISFHPEDGGRILVAVHQVVRDLAGAVLADEPVDRRFTMQHGLIQTMEVCPPPIWGSLHVRQAKLGARVKNPILDSMPRVSAAKYALTPKSEKKRDSWQDFVPITER